MNANQNKWWLAMAEKGCPDCIRGARPDTPGYPCEDCEGTGRVYLLDVQEPCETCRETGWVLDQLGLPMGKFSNDKCADCHGLGFTPTEGAWKWLEAVWRQLSWSVGFVPTLWVGIPRVTCQIQNKEGAKKGAYIAWETWDTVQEAFNAALMEAIKPLMVNAEEAEAWVLKEIR